ncbi:2-phospho-L-lactate transferase CofD [Dillenia turbinata]|uniref:2-phospho-L-lactate transferase CofD n=1 Tax=Dillenia turbinata TaxID=194707 RepID=A0AAN8VFR3_9MAGN
MKNLKFPNPKRDRKRKRDRSGINGRRNSWVRSMAEPYLGTFIARLLRSGSIKFQFLYGTILGGTAFNGVVEELKKLTTRVAHVLPVSDDGGSTAEIVRVLGGPAVGDIRSRCLRLSDQCTSEALAVRRLLGHRLPLDAEQTKSEWCCYGQGTKLWEESILYGEVCQDPITKPFELSLFIFRIRYALDHAVCVCRARIFFQSLDAAIFLFSCISDIPAESLVLPVISTNDRLTLGCELQDGTIIRGQIEISHPTTGSMQLIDKGSSSVLALTSRIKRVFYMSSEGRNLLHEVFPTPNPSVLDQLSNVDCIVYAMGSLFTSICPSLVLLGIGEIIGSRTCPKVLLLNGSHDRKTSGFTASCFVTATVVKDPLVIALTMEKDLILLIIFILRPSQYINTLLMPKDGQVPVDVQCLAAQGIFNVEICIFLH